MKKDAKIIFTPIKSELRKDIEQEKKKPIGCPHEGTALMALRLYSPKEEALNGSGPSPAEAGGVNEERERLAQFRDNSAGGHCETTLNQNWNKAKWRGHVDSAIGRQLVCAERLSAIPADKQSVQLEPC